MDRHDDVDECVHRFRPFGPVNRYLGVPWRHYRCLDCGRERRAWLSADTDSYTALGDHHQRQD